MMLMELIEFQMALSTGEQEETLFSEREPSKDMRGMEEGWLSPGTYRVVDGELYRLVPGIPPGGSVVHANSSNDSAVV